MARATGWSSGRLRWPGSLRWRVALAVAATALLPLLTLSIALLLAIDRQEDAIIDDVLNRQMLHSIEVAPSQPEASRPNTPTMHLYRLPAGSLSETPPPELMPLAIGNYEMPVLGVDSHVAVRERDGVRYLLTYNAAEHEAHIAALSTVTMAGALAIAAITLVAVYFFAGRLTHRLGELAAAVGSPTPPARFTRPDMEDEVRAVAAALDLATARQQAAMAREREFTSNLSHELRTPLTAIRTDAELIAVTPGVSDKVRERAEAITAGVDRTTHLASSLLLLAREPRPHATESVNLRQAVLAAWAQLSAGSGTRLDCEIDAATAIEADPALFDVVLRNLLGNALQHGTAARAEQRAVLCRYADHTLEVRDFGPGIAEADLPHVFQRFHRGAGSRGHGLGLTLVQHVCDACGWRIAAANATGGGGLFRLHLSPPAARARHGQPGGYRLP